MEVEAMLRHFIAQLHYQDYLDSYSQFLIHLPRSHQPNNNINNRLCHVNDDEGSIDEYYSFVMGPEKPDPFTESDSTPSKKPRKERSPGNETAMDREIWKDFPEDLFEPVLSRLPIASSLRFRSVCHGWNVLLLSSAASLSRPRASPWFYAATHHGSSSSGSGAAVYDPGEMKWHRPPPPPPTLLPGAVLIPAASAGGLVCLHDVARRRFYVCNPLTRSWRELPGGVGGGARSRAAAVGMTSAGPTYKIVRVGADGEHEVYESGSGKWARGSGPRRRVDVRCQGVAIGERVYFMRSDHREGVVEYDAGKGTWAELGVPGPREVGDRALGEAGGRVVMVGLVTRNAATCVCVWELQRMTLLWKEVDRMPNVWCLEFYGKRVRMTCLGNKGLLMLSLRSARANRLVTYDVSTRHWLNVPQPPRGAHWIACGTAFHPCLTAKA